jgi:hypothetical protein
MQRIKRKKPEPKALIALHPTIEQRFHSASQTACTGTCFTQSIV